MWAFTGNRIAVRFAYEWQDDSDHWYRSYGNENWEFNYDGLMASRFASINDIPILDQPANISGCSGNSSRAYACQLRAADHLDGIRQAMANTAQGMISERCGSALISFEETVTRPLDGYILVTISIFDRRISTVIYSK